MRALLLFVGLATAVHAQDVPLLPESRPSEPPSVEVWTCGRGADMSLPLRPDPKPVPMPEATLGGPPPVPMPNLCADAAPRIALRPGLDRFPVRPRDRFRNLPGAPRGLRDADPFGLRDRWLPYPELHDRRPVPIPEFHAPTPEVELPGDLLRLPPVAPPGDRE